MKENLVRCYRGSNYDEGVISIPERDVNIQRETTSGNNVKPFEQIYMANIPNRHLDLSLIKPIDDNNKKSEVESNTRLNYQKFSDPPLTIFNDNEKEFKSRSNPICNSYNTQQKESLGYSNNTNWNPSNHLNSYEDAIINKQVTNDRNEPTITELLKVIQRQNEQIFLLQKQVALLIENQTKQTQSNAFNYDVQRFRRQECFSSTKIEHAQFNQNHPTKLAVDVMTSFEVSIHPSQRNQCNTANVTPQDVQVQDNRPVQERLKSNNILDDIKRQVQEDNKQKQCNDLSLSLNEPLTIMERCPSPENSIHVDMKDYSSDDDESTNSTTDIGWTIYNNVMGQVNNMLKKVDSRKDFDASSNAAGILGNKTMQKVKEATLRHLQSIGVNLSTLQESNTECPNQTSNGSEYTPTEISFAVKQLLMKYLPDEQLAKLTQPTSDQPKKNLNCNRENLIRQRPEFSFATLQYMKKYNLLTSDSVVPQVTQSNKNVDVPKILDVTALKQQPKLL
ncbi:polyserase-related [Holotrichia oblita]|uniref:Polyserase-related n=1 Tax=Holotrichia oblita TaxID=644536 RepID=A0ACB9ST47_HOLOL|nr:polyserase-related [Holotrichia oblita]